jgi:predicted ATPase
LGKALTSLKRFDEARVLLDEAVQLIDQNGNRKDEAEVHRVVGELLWQQPTPDWQGAEMSFLKALEVARSQEAKGYELRAAISFARLWQSQSKRREAYDLLAPIYSWFTEGSDSKDLKDAQALLEELG